MDTKIFIESNSAPILVHKGNYNAISTHLALKALEIQKKEDEQFFRNFLLSIAFRQASGIQIDLEKEFNEQFSKL